ncbi:MAG: SpoIIE family protein phosphatase [Clostridia bacterium]|jgi:stage II sporulation protein E|nr:SpoIIE family protein phosphatase [Clostridia bacterium]
MFQNINESTIDDIDYKESKKENKKIELFTNVFAIKNIPIYIISLMISMVGISEGISPFSISIFGACIANSVPLLGIVLFSLIGTSIKFGVSGALTYILTALVLIITMFIIKPIANDEEKNEKIRLSKNIFIAYMIIQLANVGISGFTLYDILSCISISIIAVVFYKIFVNSIIAFRDFYEAKAFSIEEVLGASLMLAIAFGAFGELSIFGFSIRNILSILIVMILGWKNGVLVGTTAGVTIGVTLGVITTSDPLMVAAYAISGMVAGILNKFGKLGVIVGFGLGNIVLAYVANGYTVELIHFKEILIASIGLLAIPKSIQINIEEFIGSSKLLPIFPDRALNKSKETADKLNNVSETIQEMAKTYNVEETVVDNKPMQSNKDIFISELLDNLNGYENNMLYEDMANTEGKIVDEVFKLLIDKQQINREQLLEIFAKCNSYIVGFDDKKISEYLEENISQMIRVINMSYKISKSNFVWQKKFEENKKNIETQLKGVSKALSNMADNIEKNIKNEEQFTNEKRQIVELLRQKEINIQEISIQKEERVLIEIYMEKSNNTDIECIEEILTEVLNEKIVFNEEASIGTRLNFFSDDKFVMAIGNSEVTKNNSNISGDSILNIRLKDGKYLVAISDGMGSGNEARQSSNKALKMLENLLVSGFDKKTSIELINSSLINNNEEIFATLDIAIVDLYKGNIEFIKSGACPTYIKNNKKVQVIKANSLPAGIINDTNLQSFDRDIASGDIMIMCSDGVLDSNIEYKNKELWVKYLLEDMESTNTKKIADLILNEAIDNTYGVAKDDMSVVVCKFLNK